MGLEFDGVNGIIKNTTSDGDITIKGNDGGSEISLLTFDVSAQGAATFNSTITSTASTTITVADNSDNLTLKSTDADANAGPNLILQRDSGSPADGDAIGRIDFDADNDAGEVTSFFSIRAEIEDASDGAEDGQMKIDQIIAGTAVTALRFKSSETVFNDDSKDVDFRVESDGNTHALFVDAGNDVVGINTSNPSASWVGANNLVVSDTSSDGGITIISGTSGNGNIMFSDAQAGAFSDARGLITYLHNGDSMRFITANAEALRIDSSGKVGIGETAPLGNLHVKSADSGASAHVSADELVRR